jgi:addiction module HigA family antidote
MNPPITPGEILLEEYLEPMGISQNAMARAIGVAPRAINEIVLGKRSITPQMSMGAGQKSSIMRREGASRSQRRVS